MRAPQLRVLLIICSRHLVLAIIVSLPALGAARTMPRTRCRAILLLFVSLSANHRAGPRPGAKLQRPVPWEVPFLVVQ